MSLERYSRSFHGTDSSWGDVLHPRDYSYTAVGATITWFSECIKFVVNVSWNHEIFHGTGPRFPSVRFCTDLLLTCSRVREMKNISDYERVAVKVIRKGGPDRSRSPGEGGRLFPLRKAVPPRASPILDVNNSFIVYPVNQLERIYRGKG